MHKSGDVDKANKIADLMQRQWSTSVKPGRKVKIKVSGESVDGVVDQIHFIAKLSSDGFYFYSTAKADVRLGDRIIKEVQFRDLELVLN